MSIPPKKNRKHVICGQAILIPPNLKTKLNVCGFCLAGWREYQTMFPLMLNWMRPLLLQLLTRESRFLCMNFTPELYYCCNFVWFAWIFNFITMPMYSVRFWFYSHVYEFKFCWSFHSVISPVMDLVAICFIMGSSLFCLSFVVYWVELRSNSVLKGWIGVLL